MAYAGNGSAAKRDNTGPVSGKPNPSRTSSGHSGASPHQAARTHRGRADFFALPVVPSFATLVSFAVPKIRYGRAPTSHFSLLTFHLSLFTVPTCGSALCRANSIVFSIQVR